MRKLIVLTLVIMFALVSYGYCATNNWNGSDRTQLLGIVLPSYLVSLGTDTGLASTTVASGTAVIPVTGYSIVTKNISEKVGSVCTVANGAKGQMLQIVANTLTGSDTLVITPATCSGFTTVTLSAAKQSVTLLYLNDTLGWSVVGTANNPTVA